MKRIMTSLAALGLVLAPGLPIPAFAQTLPAGFSLSRFTTGLTQPKGIISAVGSGAAQFGQDLYIANSGANQIVKVPRSGGAFTSFAATGRFPVGVSFDGAAFGEYLYAGNAFAGGVTRIAPDGTVTPFTLAGVNIAGLAFGQGAYGSNLYAGEWPVGRIWKVDSAGNATLFSNQASTQTRYLKFSHGNGFGTYLYYTDINSGKVYRVDPSGVATVFATTGDTCTEGLDFSPGGTFGPFLYVGSLCSGNIYRVASDGTSALWAAGAVPGAADIDFQPDGQGGFTMYLVDGRDSAWAISAPAVFTIHPIFGTSFNGIVAKLTPTGGPGNLSTETGTITWGDGSITVATLSTPTGSPSELDVTGTHIYWITGRLQVVITVTDTQTGAIQKFSGNAVVSSRYTALGDSFSANEGAGWPGDQPNPNLPGCDWQLYQDGAGVVYKGSTDHIDGAQLFTNGCHRPDKPWTGNTCHRATTAYAHVVWRLLAIEGMTLNVAACSGAAVNDTYLAANGVHGDNLHVNEPPQLNAVGPDTSLITLTMGGNNVGFATVAANCVTDTLIGTTASCVGQDDGMLRQLGYRNDPGKPFDGVFYPFAGQISASGLGLNQLLSRSDFLDHVSCPQTSCNQSGTNLHDALVLLYKALKDAAPGARILVLGYPRFFQSGGSGNTCEYFTAFDQPWINDRISLMDDLVHDATIESGVAEYVDVYGALSVAGGHELCTGSPFWRVDPVTGQVGPCTGAWLNGVALVQGSPLFGSPELLHPNPCAHQEEGQETAKEFGTSRAVDQFALTSGGNHVTSINVSANAERLTVTGQWLTGTMAWTLTDPVGNTYPPGQSGQVYQTWTVWRPTAGPWTLSATNTTVGDLGVVRTQVFASDRVAIPSLPPAGQPQPLNETCTIHVLIYCTVTLAATVSPAAAHRVSSYQWFAQDGNFLAGGATVTATGSVPFKVILKTLGTGGGYRLTIFTVTCMVC